MTQSYGWIPDIPDGRDYLYRSIQPRLRLPKEVNLAKLCSEVEDQGKLGSCTAQALAGNIEFLDNRLDAVYTDVSRLFIYYNERKIMRTVDTDSGAMLRDGIKTLKNEGVCPENSWPYRIPKFDQKPSAKCYTEALRHRIKSYYRLLTHSERLACLADGYPFVFGFVVYESLETTRVAITGEVPLPKKKEKMLGGHAVLAVGFNQKTKRFLFRNSWSRNWGRAGYGTIPFEYVEALADDFWTIRR